MALMTMTTVVLAGGPPDEVAALQPGIPNKAFLEIGGVPLVTRTLRALRGTPSIGRIVVVAPKSALQSPALALADEVRQDGTRIRESLANGIEGLPPDEDVLLSTSDLPFPSVAGITAFVQAVRCAHADLCYGALEKSAHISAFPEVPHTWARMRDGTFCGTGFAALRPRVLPLLSRFIEQLGAARKNPLRLASLFGWRMLTRFAIGRLSVAQAEARASQILGAPVRAILTSYPDLAVNVDRVSDVALAERLVARLAGNSSA